MPIYKGTTELTKIADFLTATEHDITEVYFGDKKVFTVWGTYDGTLPAQYSANGSTLADYRVYGAAGGVGDRTENLLNQDESKNGDGYLPNTVITTNGALQSISFFVTEYIKINQNTEYSYFQDLFDSSVALIQFFDSSKNVISSIVQTPRRITTEYAPTLCTRFTSPQNAEYVRFNVQKLGQQNILVEGSTAPSEYVPYGYELDMSVQSENLFDPSDTTPHYRYDDNGNWIKDNGVLSSGSMKIAAGDKYEYKFTTIEGKNGGICRVNFLNANGQWLSVNKVSFNVAVGDVVTVSGTAPAGTAFVRTSQYDGELNISMIVAADTTPIYIGSDSLGEDEYVDYREQKRVRFVPITSVSKAPYNSSATIVFLTPAKDSFIVQSGSTQTIYESFDISPRVQGRVRFRCLINVEKFSSYEQILVGIRRENNTFINSVRVENLGKTYVDIDVNDIPGNSYISIMATSSTTNAGTYKYTVLGAEIRTSVPTDPPVPLPALPTVDGTNIVDYAGQSAAVPSRFYAKYRKEWF